ncbi:beta-ketoacyl synthase N-terminal-like domain-containing protein [Marinivivus vitaminiproducens]|uniref:beta-ketoacyl synthase N-terminal-like domain-containing protein n=1 Tax=Marinivivus vitaminiproducens TaxID=3035935 RepID=UPI00279F52C1|nr:beta-ketoacyl synthase N-terminal-like domain-containing protein [Geminicoccaceae bacterium SCSIO 64248]
MSDAIVISAIALDAPFGTTLDSLWACLGDPPGKAPPVTRFPVRGCRVGSAYLHWTDAAAFRAAAERTGRQALANAGIAIDDGSLRIGLALGSISAPMTEITGDGPPARASRLPANLLGQQSYKALGLNGPLVHVVSACTSSAAALFWAREILANDDADVMLVGGIDRVQPVDFAGFNVLRAMDPDGTRPFHAGRRGIVMGEGACFLVLEHEATARRRNVSVLASFSGAGLAADAHHPTAPLSRGLAAAARGALAAARLRPDAIGYVNCHGTGTVANDAEELVGLKTVFGDALPAIAVGSTKGFTGHWLGSAGALEAAVAIAALVHQAVPPMPWLDDGDTILSGAVDLAAGPRVLDHVMSNNLGFGGNNASLIFSRHSNSFRD